MRGSALTTPLLLGERAKQPDLPIHSLMIESLPI